MTRIKSTGRVTKGEAPGSGLGPQTKPQFESLRKRKPFVFWFILIATFSMVLSIVGTFFQMFS
jgi:hypothetical protein